jgi:hypothetical protein
MRKNGTNELLERFNSKSSFGGTYIEVEENGYFIVKMYSGIEGYYDYHVTD